jgi:hypothetical protein
MKDCQWGVKDVFRGRMPKSLIGNDQEKRRINIDFSYQPANGTNQH